MKETQRFIRKLKASNRQPNYNIVKGVIAAMNSVELLFAKNYLMLLHNSNFESQSLRLFRFIKQFPDKTESEAREYLSEGQNINFDKVVTSLKKRLGWTLVSEYNTQREGAYSVKWATTFQIMNNLMLYQVALNRGLTSFGFDLLNETIESAKEVEAYMELKYALELKISHIKTRTENRQITRLKKEYEFYKGCEESLVEAKNIYHDLATLLRQTSNDKLKTVAYFKSSLKRLSTLQQKTNSDRIQYYCLFASSSIFQLEGNYLSAGKIFQNLFSLILKSPVLNNKQNIGRMSVSIAENHILQGDFEVALTFCKKAKSNFSPNSFNFFQAEFLEFYCYFYTNQFYLAEKKIFGIINNTSYRESEYLINIKKYLGGCVLFAQEKYQEALSIFLTLEKIWSDTTGWNVGLRIMIMLCYKMLSNYELMALERERFRSLFDKYRHRKSISDRDKIILKIIHEFLKKNSDFKSIYIRKSDLFKLLALPKNRFQLMSHEMILFEQWFICMLEKSKYRLVF